MYAVLSEGSIAYLGDCRDAALAVLDTKDGAQLTTVTTLAGLKKAFEQHADQQDCDPEEGCSVSRLDEVLQKLDDLDLGGTTEEVLEKVRNGGERLIGQVRSLGLRGMKGLGEGLAAVGDLLQQAGEDEDEDDPSEE